VTLYSVALFLHIVGALLLFVLLSVEGFGLRIGRSAARFNQVVGPVSAFLVLVPGLYMVASAWGWKGWIAVGVTSWVVIAVLGAFTGVMQLRGRLNLPAAGISWAVRVGMAVGVVFVMTVKPDLAVSASAVIAGALVGAVAGTVTNRQAQST
jgi:hypothetical protein